MNLKKIISHPLLGMTPARLANLLITNGFRTNFVTMARVIYIFLSSFPVGILVVIEAALYKRRIAKIKIKSDPVFIIGHWRSGTTFLHYMMAEDKRLGYISNRQAFMPRGMLVARKITNMLAKMHMLEKRPMDDVKLTPESPQEEEYALLHYGVGTYLGNIFPRKMRDYFMIYADLEPFKEVYYRLVQKITFASSGKQLLLKNPVNTLRIKTLLELFPNAKFIYLKRNPYEVYFSTIRLYEKMTESFTLQKYDPSAIKLIVPELYKFFEEKYAADKKLIPQGQLLEISYEELMTDPLASAQRIYESLKLPEFSVAKESFAAFLKTQREYKPAEYKITEETKKHIDELLCLSKN